MVCVGEPLGTLSARFAMRMQVGSRRMFSCDFLENGRKYIALTGPND